MHDEPLLSVNNLTVDLLTAKSAVRPVDGVSYSVRQGECLAIVGESGSGKTVMNFAPLGLMPTGVTTNLSGSVRFDGQELIGLAEPEIRKFRGKSIGFIFQDPMSALNPVRRIGRQIAEMAELHLNMSPRSAEARALDLVKLVGISDPAARLRQFPHELSGGLRQRIVIAIALAGEPKLLIADEPTTALDVTVQAQILRLLKDLQQRLNMAMVLITHDMGVVAGAADDIVVMYAARAAECGPVDKVLVNPRHPYTKGLINAIPRRDDPIGSEFRGLPGVPPMLGAPIKGCAFAPRCELAVAACTRIRPSMVPISDRKVSVACSVVNQGKAAA
ncbi:Oligopeptide transport ATP-binding protein OppD [Ensifer psoraleae]|uniref:ABC transporter ATP-binding protein n=1 Tax=Sinorhizobium psoraleae TaxID=520838 RepID=UPI001567D620|nr:ABC transporter ATP-binding protein [Sinorhizobium psoraleae]NRP72972.1 Oligopeptide transport ATP-binding protein OppD [Sinorhizobium psoraleae]